MLIGEVVDELVNFMSLSYVFTYLGDLTLLYLLSVCWFSCFALDYCINSGF